MALDLQNDLDLTVESSCSALDQRHTGSQTHFIDMSPRFKVVKSIEDEVEALEPVDVELRVFDVCVMRFELDVRIELGSGLFGNLRESCEPKITRAGHPFPTKALDFLMCSCRKRNWRLRLLRSIVSRSTIWISPKPVRTRFLRSSHPMPPAPTIKMRD